MTYPETTMKNTLTGEIVKCYHCGNDCLDEQVALDDKTFCCKGCRDVYSVLEGSGLCNYYAYNAFPGINQNGDNPRFDYLKEPKIVKELVDYSDEKFTVVTFYIPGIHCSSCIWLLEQLGRINPAIYYSRVDFLKKQVNIRYDTQKINLHQVVAILDSIGYEPLISLQDVIKGQAPGKKDNLVKKIAVAGFCFGNIMLLSFPAYFGLSASEQGFRTFFGWLNILLCIPVVFYSGFGYLKSAWVSLQNKALNIDLPIALGISVLFIRSAAEIGTQNGPGFADTLSGLVFFLLIGRYVQRKTYYHLSFERDYRSFFPVAVQVVDNGAERPVALADVEVGQRIVVRNNEIIPADAILLKGEAKIDFSFVTGESVPVTKVLGEVIYAGGRQTAEAIELEVIKPVSQSYLTRLWNNEAFGSSNIRIETFSEKASRYFTVVLLALAIGALAVWLPVSLHRAISAFTAVLIVACPCALALSTPFTMSAALSIFDKNLFYLKNTSVVEHLAHIDSIVFDKTGTITIGGGKTLTFKGPDDALDKQMIFSVCANSAHPLSRIICEYLGPCRKLDVTSYYEVPGRGITGEIDGKIIYIGSREFVKPPLGAHTAQQTAEVHVRIDDVYIGCFGIGQQYREGMGVLHGLHKSYNLYLLSGDHSHEQHTLSDLFGADAMFFERSPQEKLDFIHRLQQQGGRVMMIGDGLNDAGALKQSDTGVAITDNVNNFSPGSDAILDGRSLAKLPAFLQFSKDALTVIYISFGISLIYNMVGLGYAVTGNLSPLVAAILMPLSTVTIVSFTSIATHVAAKRRKLL